MRGRPIARGGGGGRRGGFPTHRSACGELARPGGAISLYYGNAPSRRARLVRSRRVPRRTTLPSTRGKHFARYVLIELRIRPALSDVCRPLIDWRR